MKLILLGWSLIQQAYRGKILIDESIPSDAGTACHSDQNGMRNARYVRDQFVRMNQSLWNGQANSINMLETECQLLHLHHSTNCCEKHRNPNQLSILIHSPNYDQII